MEILEVFEDHITTTADQLPYDMWKNNKLGDSEELVEVGFDYKQVGDELTGEVFITAVTKGGDKLYTIHDDRQVMSAFIEDHLKTLHDESKAELNGGW